MELLVKDILPDLDKATDVPKRISEVRAKKPAGVASGIYSMAPGEIRAVDSFNDVFLLKWQQDQQQAIY